MDFQSFCKKYHFNPRRVDETKRHAARVEFSDLPVECVTSSVAEVYLQLDVKNAALFPRGAIKGAYHLQCAMIEADPMLIELIEGDSWPEVDWYPELAERAVTQNPQAVNLLAEHYLKTHMEFLLSIQPSILDYLADDLKKRVSSQGDHKTTLLIDEAAAQAPSRPAIEIQNFPLGLLGQIVAEQGYDLLADQIKMGWWPSSCLPMKPKNVTNCFDHLQGSTDNFKALLKSWLVTQPIRDVCRAIRTDAHLKVVRELFDRQSVAQHLGRAHPLLSSCLEQDLGL